MLLPGNFRLYSVKKLSKNRPQNKGGAGWGGEGKGRWQWLLAVVAYSGLEAAVLVRELFGAK